MKRQGADEDIQYQSVNGKKRSREEWGKGRRRRPSAWQMFFPHEFADKRRAWH
jgi:hypothetical protein